MPDFTARVASGGLINIPQNFEDMHDVEQGDLLTLRVVRHKKEDGDAVEHDEQSEPTPEQ